MICCIAWQGPGRAPVSTSPKLSCSSPEREACERRVRHDLAGQGVFTALPLYLYAGRDKQCEAKWGSKWSALFVLHTRSAHITTRMVRECPYFVATCPWGERRMLHHLQTLGGWRSVEKWVCEVSPTQCEKNTGANTGDYENRCATANSTSSPPRLRSLDPLALASLLSRYDLVRRLPVLPLRMYKYHPFVQVQMDLLSHTKPTSITTSPLPQNSFNESRLFPTLFNLQTQSSEQPNQSPTTHYTSHHGT